MTNRSLIYSVLLHALLFLPLILGSAGIPGQEGAEGDEGGQHAKQEQETGDIIPKNTNGGERKDDTISLSIVYKPRPNPGVSSEPECKSNRYYSGIGIGHDVFDNTINNVAPGYPAERAGLQVGDVVLNPEQIRGEAGTVATVLIKRGWRTLTFKIVREKICIDR